MYRKKDIVRTTEGEACQIVNLPGTFMSNGAYESIVVDTNSDGKYIPVVKNGKKITKWLKPNNIVYNLTTSDSSETFGKYVEIIYDEESINVIPKDFTEIKIETDNNGFRILKIYYENRTYKTINILIGEKNENNNR